jgi:hypothetical protein
MRRRDALVIGGLVAAALALPPVLRRLPSNFEFDPLEGFEGFRRLESGAVSGGVDPFFGLGEPASDHVPLNEGAPFDPCRALFGPEGWPSGKLPVAIFTDANCPYCKVLERQLLELRDDGVPLVLSWHEMPLLGASSERFARAALAARYLGVEEQARSYLAATPFPPGPVGLRRLAEALSVAPEDLTREIESSRVTQAMAKGLSLGRRLGLPGTPGTVIGRTLVIGAIKQADLERLVEMEQAEPQAICS